MFNSTVGAALRGRPQIRIVKPRVFASAGLRPALKLLLQNGGGHEGRPCNRRNGGGRKEKAATGRAWCRKRLLAAQISWKVRISATSKLIR
jgi:hypothetical protein